MRVLGGALVVAGLLLVAIAFGWSWAVAADTDVAYTTSPNQTETLVGVQGPAVGGNVSLYSEPNNLSWRYSGSVISFQDVSALTRAEHDALEDATGERFSTETVLATYADERTRECAPDEECFKTGILLIDPQPAPHVVYEWSYNIETREDSEVHDAEVLPSGELLVADMEYESIFTVDLSTGERTWTWNASSYYEEPPDPRAIDWLHLNDVDRIGDGRYLVSIRNANQLLVVERGEGVVQTINEDDDSVPESECAGPDRLYDGDGDGDVRCGDPAILDEQHNPDWLGSGAVLVADSENDRVVELHKTQSSGRWTVAWAVSKTGDIYLDWPRDADRLPDGRTLVTDSRNNRVVEIDRNGTLVASYPTEPLPYEADRVPFEERVNEPHPGTDRATAQSQWTLPFFSTLIDAARHVVPLPHWISGLHVLVLFVATGCWLGGLAVLAKDAWQ